MALKLYPTAMPVLCAGMKLPAVIDAVLSLHQPDPAGGLPSPSVSRIIDPGDHGILYDAILTIRILQPDFFYFHKYRSRPAERLLSPLQSLLLRLSPFLSLPYLQEKDIRILPSPGYPFSLYFPAFMPAGRIIHTPES
jgi:hypothetical protein